MKTMTIESENPLVLNAGEPLEMPSCNDLDPDFIIEATGGPTDTGGGPQIGPLAQPPC